MTVAALRSEVILKELLSVREIVDSWCARVEQGLPCVELPASEEALEAFLRQFVGEMLLASGKCQNMAMILAER